MNFLQESRGFALIMHNLHLICENNTLDGPEKDDYTEFQISSISISDKRFNHLISRWEILNNRIPLDYVEELCAETGMSESDAYRMLTVAHCTAIHHPRHHKKLVSAGKESSDMADAAAPTRLW